MADRLTQLQDAVNCQAENFCNGIGILQQTPTPTKLEPDKSQASATGQTKNLSEDQSLLFATLIARTAKDIDHLIESLPSEESSTELQLTILRRLELENNEAIGKLKEVVERGEKLLERIQSALCEVNEMFVAGKCQKM